MFQAQEGILVSAHRGVHLPFAPGSTAALYGTAEQRTFHTSPSLGAQSRPLLCFPGWPHRRPLQSCDACPAPGPFLGAGLPAKARRLRQGLGTWSELQAHPSPSQQGLVEPGFGNRPAALFRTLT